MVFDSTMKKFLTVYDYGQGGIWYYINASSKKEITNVFPELEVVDREPDWFDEEMRIKIQTYTMGDKPTEFLRRMMKTS